MSEEDSNSSMELSRDILQDSRGGSRGNTVMCNGAANGTPYLQIVEQPKSRGFRFRYACEGKSHGGIQGESCGKNKKSFPTVQIHNYSGKARVVVKLVTDEPIPRPHAHELIGKNCKEGICSVEINCAQNNGIISFPNMGILHVTRKNVADILKTRIMEEMKVSKVMNDPLHQLDINDIQLTGDEERRAVEQASSQAKDMTLNVVRLCFQAYLADSRGGYSNILSPVPSQAIYDSKSPGAAALKICRMDKHAGCCTGNEEVFLLCDKVQKEDITVRFFEMNDNNDITWEALGNFGPTDVHRQYAIVFRTPQYHNPNINKPVNVFVQLRRTTDNESSDAKPFTYYPQQKDQDEVMLKKQKAMPCFTGVGVNATVFNFTTPVNNTSSEAITLVSQQVNGVNTVDSRFVEEGGQYTGGNTYFINSTGLSGGISNGNGLIKTHVAPTVFMNHNPSNNMAPASQVRYVQGYDQSDMNLSQGNNNLPEMQGRGLAPPTDTTPQSNGVVKMQSRGMPSTAYRTKKEMLLKRKQPIRMDLEEDSSMYTDEVDSAMQPAFLSSGIDSGVEMSSRLVKAAGGTASLVAGLEKLTVGEDTERMMVQKQQMTHGKVELTNQKVEEKEMIESKEPGVMSVKRGVDSEETNVTYKEEITNTEVEPRKEDIAELPDEDIQELAWRVAENTALAMQEFAKTGNIAYLLLIQRHLVAVQDSNGDNALHMAVIHRKVEPLRSLLCVASTLPDNHAINTYNSLQQSPLHLAVITNQPDMVEILVDNHADLSIVDKNGNTPIHLAASLGYVRCLQNLVNISTSKFSTLESRKILRSLNYEGFTPVHLCVREGHMTCLRHLVVADADINVPDGKSGYTPLHHAADCVNLGIVGYLLLEAAAEPNCPAFNGVSALHVAVGRGSLSIAALLIASGADPEAECTELPTDDYCCNQEGEEEEGHRSDVKGMTPIDMAVDNHKMLSVLRGEAYSTVTESSLTDEFTPSLYSEILDSGLGFMAQDGGDLEMMDLVTRMKLGRVLDNAEKGSNWEVLAKHFNLDKLCEDLSAMKSPTRALLDNLEVLDGTVNKLKEALVKMGRTDCIEVIEEGLALNRQAAHNLVEKRKKEADTASFSGVQRRLDSDRLMPH